MTAHPTAPDLQAEFVVKPGRGACSWGSVPLAQSMGSSARLPKMKVRIREGTLGPAWALVGFEMEKRSS